MTAVRPILILSSVFLLISCSADRSLTVFSAMSLTDALTEVSQRFERKTGIKVDCHFAGSSTLQRQIEKGAPADVFISASPKQIEALQAKGLVDAQTRRDILTNNLVLIAPVDTAHSLTDTQTLTQDTIKRIAIGEPNSVPAGIYAKEVLINLGVWDTVQKKLVPGLDVRATLAYVESGNVDLGIVYRTDATTSKKVKILYQFPASSHAPIVYPAVLIKGAQHHPHAREFIRFLKTSEVAAIFRAYGFSAKADDTIEGEPSDQATLWRNSEVAVLILSLKAAVFSLLLILPPGLWVGWILAKSSFRGKSFLNTLVMLPLVLPPVVSGFCLLMLFSKRGLVGQLLFRILGIEIVFSWLGVVLAVSVISFPLLVRGIVTAMEGVDPRLENAARTLGAHPLKVFFTVTLPLSYRGVIGGAILGFSKSLGEFGATMMLAGNIAGKTQTLALAVFTYVQTGEDASAYRLVFISTVVAFVTMWIAERLYIKRNV